jgi:hypothetical protein
MVALRFNRDSNQYEMQGDRFKMKLDLSKEWSELAYSIKLTSQHHRSRAEAPSASAVISGEAPPPVLEDSDTISAAWIPEEFAKPTLKVDVTFSRHGDKANLHLGDDNETVPCLKASQPATLQAGHVLALFIKCTFT